jgi:PhnB protein
MSKISEDFLTVTPYLIIKNAAGFIQFTQDVFGAAVINKHMRDENIFMHGE